MNKNAQAVPQTDRERRRQRANEQAAGDTQDKNEGSKTNTAYEQIRMEMEQTSARSRRSVASPRSATEEQQTQNLDKEANGKELDPSQQSALALAGTNGGEGEDSDDEQVIQAPEKISVWPCCPPFFIQENGEFRKYWEIGIIFLALYNAAVIPLQLFFDPNPGIIDNDVVRCSDAVVDLLFLIDIIFEFRTTYLDTKLGEEERNPHVNEYMQDDQFDFVYSRVKQARNSLKEQQEVVDKMEKQMRAIRRSKAARERRADDKQT